MKGTRQELVPFAVVVATSRPNLSVSDGDDRYFSENIEGSKRTAEGAIIGIS